MSTRTYVFMAFFTIVFLSAPIKTTFIKANNFKNDDPTSLKPTTSYKVNITNIAFVKKVKRFFYNHKKDLKIIKLFGNVLFLFLSNYHGYSSAFFTIYLRHMNILINNTSYTRYIHAHSSEINQLISYIVCKYTQICY